MDDFEKLGGSRHGGVNIGASIGGDFSSYEALLNTFNGRSAVNRAIQNATGAVRKTASKIIKQKITDYCTVNWEKAKERTKIDTKARNGVATVTMYGRSLQVSYFNTRPAVTHDTTGANRQPVSVQVKRNAPFAKPFRTGFIWQGRINMRDEFGGKPTGRSFHSVYTLSLPQVMAKAEVYETSMEECYKVFIDALSIEIEQLSAVTRWAA